MELMEGLLSRRSIRKYQDKKIPKDILEKIIQAGECAPSAHNTQPWHFIIVEDKEKLKLFSRPSIIIFISFCLSKEPAS